MEPKESKWCDKGVLRQRDLLPVECNYVTSTVAARLAKVTVTTIRRLMLERVFAVHYEEYDIHRAPLLDRRAVEMYRDDKQKKGDAPSYQLLDVNTRYKGRVVDNTPNSRSTKLQRPVDNNKTQDNFGKKDSKPAWDDYKKDNWYKELPENLRIEHDKNCEEKHKREEAEKTDPE